MGEQTIEYRLSKGLAPVHGASRDLRANPRPTGSQPCTGCGEEIRPSQSTMWIRERPYHVRCGHAEVERREAEARAVLARRLAARSREPADG